jgi:hypothetical protein
MIIEERMYILQVGKVPEFLRHYESSGMQLQLKYLPHMVGFYTSEIGPQNMVVHLWAFNDLGHRDSCRAAMQADPAWQTYLPKVLPLMISQETRILKCAPFFVETLKKMVIAAQ